MIECRFVFSPEINYLSVIFADDNAVLIVYSR